ncbi:glutathione S-transferase-like [Aplysia californica]|uniref:Glutathione S-transferase-like n=1 Tax=Aplysia californica TaxID=6500 RepID=A0ABM1W415_APLCA|nr:glutathione S-transferase-like [Aplysia californica]
MVVAELVKNYLNVDLPKYMGFFKNLLEKNNTGYFVGNSLTLADLALFDFLRNLRKNQPTVTDNFPVVKALTERVDSNPKIRDYLNNRKPLPQ